MAEEGHLTRAAERLGLRASSLSQQIIALERELDATLFVRTQSGMTPTAAALALLPHARRILEEAELGARAVRDTTLGRPLRVGVTPGAPPAVLSTLYAEAVEIDDLPAARQLDLLRRGALDAGLLALPEDVDSLRVAVVSERPLGVLVSDAHSLALLDEVGWEDLTGLDLLLYERKLAPGYHDRLLADCAAAGCSRPRRTASAVAVRRRTAARWRRRRLASPRGTGRRSALVAAAGGPGRPARARVGPGARVFGADRGTGMTAPTADLRAVLPTSALRCSRTAVRIRLVDGTPRSAITSR